MTMIRFAAIAATHLWLVDASHAQTTAATGRTVSALEQLSAPQVVALIALAVVLLVILVVAWLLPRIPKADNVETLKIRFAAATFTGILILFVFTAILYFADGSGTGVGKDIFEKAITAMTPLAGVIVGYLFNAHGTAIGGVAKGNGASGAQSNDREVASAPQDNSGGSGATSSGQSSVR